ncbi:MAG: polysaccharide deacetylase family protein [Lachnospiraceae bacterium]|nr:polysaccharide deacetylase family protein [Lachnospiraceae bacterium]
MTAEEFERRKRAERIRAAKKRRHRKVMINRALAVLFLIAFVTILVIGIILLDRFIKGPAPAEPDDRDVPAGVATITPTNPPTPTPTPAPTFTPTPSPVPAGVKRVAFTFDDGPAYNGLTVKFAEKLASYGGAGTWFVIGNRINDETAKDLKRAADLGMAIEIHAWTHEYYFDQNPNKLDDELQKTADAIEKATGKRPTLFRPPGGNFTDKQVTDISYPVILWSVDTNDWKLKGNSTEEERANNVQKIVDTIMRQTQDGSIVLMHEIYNNSYDAFCIAIDKLAKEGYVFVTVQELIGDELRAGHKYSSWYKR